MLAEFAITPEVFEPPNNDADRQQWLSCLDRLADCLFPRTSAGPVVVSNMCDEQWLHEVKCILEKSADIRNAHVWGKMLEKIVIRRALAGERWPQSELDWLSEAICLARMRGVMIDRIISSEGGTDSAERNLSNRARTLSEVSDRGFWKDITSTRSLEMKLSDQVRCLRSVSEKFDWIAIYSPHIQPSDDSEALVVVTLLNELYTHHSERPTMVIVNSECYENVDRVHRYVTEQTPDLTVLTVGWRKLLDRLVFAGDFAEASSENRQLKPRCGIALCHLFTKRDKKTRLAPTTWTLLSESQLSDLWFHYDPFTKLARSRTNRKSTESFNDDEFQYRYQ